MQSVRRGYVYFMTAVSLGALAIGAANLLRLALDQAAVALGVTSVNTPLMPVRDQVSLYAAMAVAALPIWLVHWWLAQRALRRPDHDAEDEHRSAVRTFYLGLALAVSFGFWLTGALDLIARVVLRVSGVPVVDANDVTTFAAPISTAVVAGAVWAYHRWVARRDAGPARRLDDGPRLYLYGAAFAGAMLLVFGGADLLRLLVDALAGPASVDTSGPWWAQPLATGISWAVVGLVAWAVDWRDALLLLRAPGAAKPTEAMSVLRSLYLYLGVVVGIGFTLGGLGDALATLLRALLGLPATPGAAAFARNLFEPLLAAVPFALLWVYQQRRAAGEAAAFGDAARQATTRRLSTYAVALVGLAFTAFGLANTLGLLIDLLLGGTSPLDGGPDWWRGQVSGFGAVTLVGAVAWLWGWYAAQRALAADPPAEQVSTTRRAYLYIVLAAALVSALSSLSVVIYRVLAVALGAASSVGLVSNISTALGVAIVSVALAIFHGAALRRDLAVRPITAAPVAAAENVLEVLLAGPPGADLAAELEDLRRHLPTGFSLRVDEAPR